MKGNLTLLCALVVVGLGACSAYGPGSAMHGYGMGPGLTPGMGPPLQAGSVAFAPGLAPLPAGLSAEQRAQVEGIAADARARIDAVLTAQQREEWRRASAAR